jgi:HAE1 family hydrophobic/amphiphilic exporter-1
MRPMSLKDCVQQALQQNYDVRVQRYNTQISLYNYQAVYSGYDPVFNVAGQQEHQTFPATLNLYSTNKTPYTEFDGNAFKSGVHGLLPWGLQYDLSGKVNEYSGEHSGLPFDSSDGTVGVVLTQPLLKNFWIDQTRLNIRVAKNQLKNSEQGLRLQLISSVTAVVTAYYELIFAQQNVQVQQKALELARTQLDQDRHRVQLGTLPALSVQQDESQVAQSEANVITAQRTLDTNQNALINLLTDRYSQWRDVAIEPTATLDAPEQIFDVQESWNKGLANRPDLMQAKLNVERQGIVLKYYRNQLFPELDLVGSYGINGASSTYSGTFGDFNEGNNPFYSYGAQLTMPLGNVGPRNEYKASKTALQLVLTQLGQLEQNVMVEIDNAVKQARSDYQSVQATRQTRIYAEAALEAEQKTYAIGNATTFEVLQYQNNLTAARSQESRALATYNQTLAILAQQEGTTLEHYNINFETK